MKVLKFQASWCQPCKMLSRVMDEIKTLPLEVEAVDIDENRDMAIKYNVRGVPTMIVVDEGGVEVKRVSGLLNEQKVLEFFTV